MKQPFEGLFGDTCETRLLQFLLPMYGIEFDMAELVEEIGLTRQSIAKAMNKFAARGMVRIRRDGRTWLYSINEDSPLVKRLEDFDNSLIESMVGKEEFEKIQEINNKSVPASSFEDSLNFYRIFLLCQSVMKNFSYHGLESQEAGRIKDYAADEDSRWMKILEYFDNSNIDSIFRKDAYENIKMMNNPVYLSRYKDAFHYFSKALHDSTKTDAPYVSSKTQTYRSKKKVVKR